VGRPEPDSVVSLGVRWATRVTSIGLEFALPPLLGGYLDRRWGTGSLLTIVGALFGFLAGMVHLLAIAREDARLNPPAGGRPPTDPPPESTSDGSNAPQSGWSDHG
jgi:ATP synthase protein I